MNATKKAWREVRGQAFHARATTHQVDARAGPHAPLIQQSEKKNEAWKTKVEHRGGNKNNMAESQGFHRRETADRAEGAGGPARTANQEKKYQQGACELPTLVG